MELGSDAGPGGLPLPFRHQNKAQLCCVNWGLACLSGHSSGAVSEVTRQCPHVPLPAIPEISATPATVPPRLPAGHGPASSSSRSRPHRASVPLHASPPAGLAEPPFPRLEQQEWPQLLGLLFLTKQASLVLWL